MTNPPQGVAACDDADIASAETQRNGTVALFLGSFDLIGVRIIDDL
jgi:hypothetical protein